MTLNEEIQFFFKEADDVEDTRKAPEKRYFSGPPLEPGESSKSSFEEGKVHKIMFKNLTPGQRREYFTLYRKINNDEYNKLLRNYKILAIVKPDNKEENYIDVYYYSLPKEEFGDRHIKDKDKKESLTYFVEISKQQLNDIPKEEIAKYKIEKVPLKDVYETGLANTRYISYIDIKLNREKAAKAEEDKEKRKQKWAADIEKKKKEKEEEEELVAALSGKEAPKKEPELSPEEKEKLDKIKRKAVNFYIDEIPDRLLKSIKTFSKMAQNNTISSRDRDEAKKKLNTSFEKFVDEIFMYTEDVNVIDAITALFKEKTQDQPRLHSLLVTTITNQKDIRLEESNKKNIKMKKNTSMKEAPEQKSLIKLIIRPGSHLASIATGLKKEKSDLTVGGEVLTKEVELTSAQLNVLRSKDGLIAYEVLTATTPEKKSTPTTPEPSADPVKKVLSQSDYERNIDKYKNYKSLGTFDKSGNRVYIKPSDSKDKKEKDLAVKKLYSPRIPGGTGDRSQDVPVNRGVKQVAVSPSSADKNIYVVDIIDKKVISSFPKRQDAENLANGLNKKEGTTNKYKVLPYLGLKANGISIDEASFTDIVKSIFKGEKGGEEGKKGTQVSFTAQASKDDKDSMMQVTGKIKKTKFNKDKKELTLTLESGGRFVMTMRPDGHLVGYYEIGDQVHKVLDAQGKLSKLLDKVFPKPEEKEEAPKDKKDNPIESLIREHVKRVLKETDINQYMGVQGPDVKKKRLNNYMQKYPWGFQDDQDSYQRRIGGEIHAVVSKLVFELGKEGVDVFNSYAPKGYEIKDQSDLNGQGADNPVGAQLTRPYNPDALVGRGGRIAEEDSINVANAKKLIADFNDSKDQDEYAKQIAIAYTKGTYPDKTVLKKAAERIIQANIAHGKTPSSEVLAANKKISTL